MAKPAAFLDRDGVINQEASEGQYVTRWEDFRVLPGVVEGIAQLNRAGLSVIVVTNQRCVAKGLISEVELQKLHQKMIEYFAEAGATIDAIYYCPHAVEPPCLCRKPAPGMLLEAARTHGLDLAASWMMGDSESDIQAGKKAGCRTIRLSRKEPANGKTTITSTLSDDADVVATSLLEAVRKILPSGNPQKEIRV
ncbi:MAG TPA: HAD family hydrolase [Candidatus Acidoferrum sp.]